MAPGNTGADPRLSFDDPLLDGLLILCKLHGCSASRGTLSAGLPMPEQRMSPDLLPRAAARAGLQGRLLQRDLIGLVRSNAGLGLEQLAQPLLRHQPADRIDESWLPRLRDTANEISSALGFQGNDHAR